jgi:hypothetical protein
MKAVVAYTIARPGNRELHGAELMNWRLVLNISPQLGLGGGAPNPRYARADSVIMAREALRVASTMIGERALGIMYVPANYAGRVGS